MNIPACLNYLQPGAQWALTENDFSTLQWIGPGSAPSWAEIEAAWEQIQSLPAPAPEATPLQVRLFLERRGIPLENIPAAIASVTAAGSARNEALIRWDKTLSFPKDHPLVVAVAGLLGLNLDEVWGSILAIE